MNKKELEFRKILEVLDNDFANYMLDKDFKMLEIDGLSRINTFEFKKTYWSKPTEEVTANPNANMGNTGYNKSYVNLISEMATPINKLSGLYLIRKYGNKINNNGDNLVKSFINGENYIHNLSFFEVPYCEFEDASHIVKIDEKILFKTSKEIYKLFNDGKIVYMWNGKEWKQVIGASEKEIESKCTFVRLGNGKVLGLTNGHIIPTFCPHCGKPEEEKPINELREAEDFLKNCSLPKINDVPTNIDNDTLLLLGLFIAEGSARINRNKKTNELQYYLFQIACSQPEIVSFVETYAKNNNYGYRKDSQKIVFYQPKAWLQKLSDMGFNIPCLAETKMLPEWTFSLPYEQVKYLLRGMYSGDGHCSKSKKHGQLRIGYTTTSWQLATQLCYILQRHGYHPFMNFNLYSNFNTGYHNRDIFTINIYGEEAERFIKEIGFLNEYKNKIADDRTRHITKRCENDEIVKVTSISKDRNTRGTYQYEFEVEGNYYMSGTGILVHNCIGLSLYPLLTDGLSFNSLKSNPPKRASSFVNQTGRYIQYAANCFAGATALTDFFPNYSYFTMKQSGYTDKERENDIQNLVFCLNDEIRLGLQSPFSNVSILGPDTMRFMFQNYLWGTDSKIDDLMDEIMKNQAIYAKFIAKGQIGGNGKPKGLPYRFPVTTLVAEKSFKREYPEIWEEILKDNANLCHLNILNSYDENLKSLSMCCRLQPSLEDLLKINTNGTFGSFLQIGSHAVVTINLPRIAYEAKGNMDEYLRILEKRMDKAREILHIHRVEILSKRRLKYHYFFAKKYLDLNKNFFSTIGFVGLPNAIEIMGTKIIEPDGLEMAKKILSFMKKKTVEYSQELGVMFNIEEIPAESASGSLAQKDKILFKGSYDFYDNQFVPLSYDIDVFKRIDIEGELQKDCTGGSISHINLDGRPDPNALYDFTNKILENSNLKQFAFNAGFTVCKDGHTNMGVYKQCPTCNSIDVDWVTRIVGYFTNVSAWNRLKKLEFTTRKWNKIT